MDLKMNKHGRFYVLIFSYVFEKVFLLENASVINLTHGHETPWTCKYLHGLYISKLDSITKNVLVNIELNLEKYEIEKKRKDK